MPALHARLWAARLLYRFVVLKRLQPFFHRVKRVLPILKAIFVCTVFLLAVRALRSILAGYSWKELTSYLHQLPPEQVAAAALLALIAYFVTTGYDSIAFRHIDHDLSYGRIALAAFTAYAINNNLGMSGVVGSSLRYRYYRRWGVTKTDIVKIFVFCTVTFYLGFAMLGGIVFVVWPPVTATSFHLPFGSVQIVGVALLFPALAYSSWILVQRAPLRLRRWRIELPKRSIFVAQLVISMGDWVIAAAVLRAVLPTNNPVPYVTVLGTFFMAQIAGLASNVPGGLGVFEAVVLVALKPFLSPVVILGALVTFRAVYFLIPLAIALIVLGAHELRIKLQGRAVRADGERRRGS